jgi:nucleoside transporter
MDPSLRLRLSVMMFLEYFIWGAWGVVIFTFMLKAPADGGLGFPGDLVGWIDSTLAIGAMISPLFLGLFADRLFATQKLLAVLHIAGAVLLAWAGYHCHHSVAALQAATPGDAAAVTAFRPFFWIMLGYALCYMPTLTLTNSLSFRNLSDPDRYFGSIRVWGTVGWIAAGLLVGLCLKAVSAQPLFLAAGASLALGVFCVFLPHTPPAGGSKTLGDALGLPALAMVKNPSFLVFVICSLLISVVLKFYYQQGNPFLTDLGVGGSAAVQTIGQVSEIFFMLLIPVGLRRLGTKGMLVAGMLAWCLRYAIFATQNVPAVVGIGLPLHGICYDFFFVVSYLYVDRQAPSHLRASAQGMITFITLGVGMFIGALFAGAVLERFTTGTEKAWTPIWLIPLAGSAVATAIFWVLFREPDARAEPSSMTKAMEALEPAEPAEPAF